MKIKRVVEQNIFNKIHGREQKKRWIIGRKKGQKVRMPLTK